ncbi:MAG: helix-hairpin-helix domain-containing protein [Candidatus Limnocylindrales bacterium]
MDTSAPWRELEATEEDAARVPTGRSGSRAFLVTIGVAAVLAIASVTAVAFVELRPSGRVELVSGAEASLSPGPSAQMLVVQVAGAVVRPGVFSLPQGSRVADAIRAAGGYSPDVDPRQAESKLNLAAKLQDAELVAVPRLGEGSGTAPPTGATSGLLNLNTATAEQLDALPGIGPATAAKILASRSERSFASVDDLVSRKLVTASTLAKFRDKVTVG